MQLEPLCPVGAGIDRPQALSARMGVLVEAGGILRDQHQRVFADACGRGLVVGMKQRLQIHLAIVEKPIGRLGLAHLPIQCRADGGGGMFAECLRLPHQARLQTRIGAVHVAEFLLGPGGGRVGRRRQAQPPRRTPAQHRAPIAMQGQGIDGFDPGGGALLTILAPPPGTLAEALPIGRLVQRPGTAPLIDKAL